MSRSMSRPRALLTAGVAVTVAGALCSSAAFAAGGPRLHDGRVLARGAAAEFGVTVQCPEGWRGSVGVSILQVVENRRFASGGTGAAVECTGKKQRLTLHAQASNGSPEHHPFRSGPASVTGEFRFVDAQPTYGPPALPYVPVVGDVDRRDSSPQIESQRIQGVVDLR